MPATQPSNKVLVSEDYLWMQTMVACLIVLLVVSTCIIAYCILCSRDER